MAELYITSQKLVETLKIATQDLIETEQFFDSIQDDEWELTEGKDYQWFGQFLTRKLSIG